MDAFYASIEQRDTPAYRGKPIVVGGSPEGRGVVATASYEARKYGIHSAMSCRRAYQLCKRAIFVRPRFEVYRDVSRQIRAIFQRYTDLIEPLSLDEAYLDVTDDKMGKGYALDMAQEIRQAIREELNLTASAGVSVNKFVAKIASDLNKPDGLTFIGPSSVVQFMEQLAVEKFHGVGKVTAARMKSLGLHTGADLKRLTEGEIVRYFGKPGRFFYKIVRGIDDRPVQSQRIRKSLGAEDTFAYDLETPEEMHTQLERVVAIVYDRLRASGLKGRTVTLKVKYHDFKQITRSHSFTDPVDTEETLAQIARDLLDGTDLEDKKVRLLGVSLSNFDLEPVPGFDDGEANQLKLF